MVHISQFWNSGQMSSEIKTSNASSALCHTLIICGFVLTRNPAYSLAEHAFFFNMWFVVTGNPAFSLLLLACGVIVTRKPAFSLAEQPFPEGGSIFIESSILIG